MGEFATFDLTEAMRIARGPDSSVYRMGNFVVKRYHQLEPSALHQYQQATNAVSQSLEVSPLIQTGQIEGEEWKARFTALPVLFASHPELVSHYVAGPNGFNMLKPLHHDATSAIFELKDREEAEFLTGLNRSLQRGTLAMEEYIGLTHLGEFLRRVPMASNIVHLSDVSRVNTKIRADVPNRTLHVVVTDLAAHVSALSYRR